MFPGNVMQQPAEDPIDGGMRDVADESGADAQAGDETGADAAEAAAAVATDWSQEATDTSAEPELVEGDVVQEMDLPTSVIEVQAEESDAAQEGQRAEPGQRRPRGRGRTRPRGESRTPRKTQETAHPQRARKTASKPRSSRGRGRTKEVPPTE